MSEVLQRLLDSAAGRPGSPTAALATGLRPRLPARFESPGSESLVTQTSEVSASAGERYAPTSSAAQRAADPAEHRPVQSGSEELANTAGADRPLTDLPVLNPAQSELPRQPTSRTQSSNVLPDTAAAPPTARVDLPQTLLQTRETDAAAGRLHTPHRQAAPPPLLHDLAEADRTIRDRSMTASSTGTTDAEHRYDAAGTLAEDSDTPAEITIHIGQLDIRPAATQPAPSRPRSPSTARLPALADYLRGKRP